MLDGWGDLVRLCVVLVLVVVAEAVVRRVRRRRLRGQQDAGTTLVAVRTTKGEHPELSDRWQRRLATPDPGRLELSHRSGSDRDHVRLEEVTVRARSRDLTGLESFTLDDVFDRVLTLRTAVGEVEVAVGREQAEWLRRQLAVTDLPAAD